MQLDRPFIRLPYVFDADRLIEEVSSISDDAWQAHPTGHVGNTALSLVARSGDRADDSIGGVHAPTANLDLDSYLAQVIEAFQVPVGRTRLMRIDPGAEATPHFDAHLYWFDRVRIHVPIITTPDVTFLCGDERVHMAAGDSWVFDTFRRHNVLNPAPSHRVHLVIDTVGSPTMWEAVRSAEGASPVEVAFEPGRRAAFDSEQESIAPVMPADQMASLGERFVALLPDGEAGERFAEAVRRHVASWSEAWTSCGSDPHAPVYRSILDRFADRLAEFDDVTIEYNRASARYVAAALLVNSALGPTPPGTPMRQSKRRRSREAGAVSDSTIENAAPPTAPSDGPSGRPAASAAPQPTSAESATPTVNRFDRPIFVVSPPCSGSQLIFDEIAASPDAYLAPQGTLAAALVESSPADSRRVVTRGLRDRRGHAPHGDRMVRYVDQIRLGPTPIGTVDRIFPDAAYICALRRADRVIPDMVAAWRSQRFVTAPELPGWDRADGLRWSLATVADPLALVDLPIEEVCAHQWSQLTATLLDDLDRHAFGRWTTVDADEYVEEAARLRKVLGGFTGLRRNPISEEPSEIAGAFGPTTPLGDGVLETSAEVDRRVRRRLADGPGTVRARRASPRPDAGGAAVERLASRHTSSFVELLEKAGASVLVSTYQFGRVAVLRAGEEAINTEFTKLPRPMGLAVGGDGRLAVGAGDEIWTYRNQPLVSSKVDPDRAEEACFVLSQRHHTGDIAVHELAYAADGELWVVNTRFSCLATLDSTSSFVPRWKPPFVTSIVPEDRCHLNGLALRDGRPRYVSMFHASDTAQGWRDHRADGGMIVDVSSSSTVASGLCMPHSPRWHDGRLWVLESGKGSLSVVEPESGEVDEVVRLPGFTRGLAFIGRYALVGLSQVRESVFDDLPLTNSTEPLHSGVWIVDVETGGVAGFIRFDGAVEEVFDVQIWPDGPAMVLAHDDELREHSFVVATDRVAANL